MEVATGYFALAVGGSGALGAIIGMIIVKALKSSLSKPMAPEKSVANEIILEEVGNKIRTLQETIVGSSHENLRLLFGENANILITANPTIHEFLSDPYGLGRVNVCFSELLNEVKKGNYSSYLLKRTVSLLNESMMMVEEPQIKEKINSIISELDEIWYNLAYR